MDLEEVLPVPRSYRYYVARARPLDLHAGTLHVLK